MRIVFKSGTVLDVDVTNFTTSKNPIHGLSSLKWTDEVGDSVITLHHVNLDEVAAIAAVHEPDNTDSEIPGEIL